MKQAYPIHPAAEIFPMMSDSELSELANDIKENGQIEPVVIYDGMVLDGRNRLRACEIAEIEPKAHELTGINSPVIYVLSKNLHRRHLTPSQRGAIGAETIPLLEEEARKRQAEAGRANLRHESRPIGHNSGAGASRRLAAELVQVGEGTVQRADEVRRKDPVLFEKIKSGEMTANAARNMIDEKHVSKDQRRKGEISFAADTPRKEQIANANKRRMIDGLSLIGGTCSGLSGLNVEMIFAISEHDEILTWATKAEQHAGELRRFAAKLRKVHANGKSA